tara:strand:- start:2550 stop:4334 length:1785 start_codon:yes stop_codon:yes gene_type:complete
MARLQSKKIDFKYNIKLYLSYLKNYRTVFILILFMILIVESTYIFDKYLFKILIDKGTEFTGRIINVNALIEILFLVAGAYILVSVLRILFKFIHIHLMMKFETSLIADLKRKFFNHLLGLSYNFHVTHKTGGLISKLVRLGGAIERMTDVLLFNFSPLILQLVVVVISLMYFSLVPALVVLFTVLIFVSYCFCIQKIQEKSSIAAYNVEDNEKSNVADIFTNIDSVKCFGKENKMRSRFKKLSELTKRAALKNWNYFRFMDSGQSLILALGIIFLFYFSLKDFLSGKLTLGSVVFIYTVFGTMMGPLFSFVHGIRNFYRAMASFEVIFKFNKIENEIKDKVNAKKLKVRNGTIEFKDITFRYGKRELFKNFNLKINKNEKVAFVGHSGCGKTTLIKLLYRLYDVNSGGILIDGKDIRDFKKESLRREIAIVPQECILFDDTLYNNISFSNSKAKKPDVFRAIKFAQLDKIINDFPKGERTIVGERGVRLSGGEKQRVSIARAILADKKILVLDEATSSLDSRTEHEIQKDLAKLMEGRTSIIVAHRLSTIMGADKIIVMEKGKIVQIGNHRQLIRKEGKYKELWNLQKGGYIK